MAELLHAHAARPRPRPRLAPSPAPGISGCQRLTAVANLSLAIVFLVVVICARRQAAMPAVVAILSHPLVAS